MCHTAKNSAKNSLLNCIKKFKKIFEITRVDILIEEIWDFSNSLKSLKSLKNFKNFKNL